MPAIKSLDELKRIREEALQKKQMKATPGNIQVIVAMGTCGIAAGARDTMKSVLELHRIRKGQRRNCDPDRLHRPLRTGTHPSGGAWRSTQGCLWQSKSAGCREDHEAACSERTARKGKHYSDLDFYP